MHYPLGLSFLIKVRLLTHIKNLEPRFRLCPWPPKQCSTNNVPHNLSECRSVLQLWRRSGPIKRGAFHSIPERLVIFRAHV